MDSTSLIDRLLAHRTVGEVPREQLVWLASVGVEQILEPGEILTASPAPVKAFYVVLEGHLSIRVNRGAGPHVVMEWHGGDVTGILPYSRVKTPPGSVVAEERTTVLAVDPGHLRHMTRECPELTAVLVHVMLDRARVFKSSELLDEKMASLGRLAAGLAHELNNPASAIARSAKTLVERLDALEPATRRFCALSLSETQRRGISSLRDDRSVVHAPLSPLELADRRDAMSINRRRSGTRSGAMSGSTSLNGREWTPGMKKPVTLKNNNVASPTSVRSRSLDPGPSASNSAASRQRHPVTALPRRIAVVPGGTKSSTMRQNDSNSLGRPPNARRMTFSRFSCSVRPPWRSSTTGSATFGIYSKIAP